MEKLIPYSECLVCGSKTHRVIVSEEQLSAERRYLDSFFRKIFVKDTPEHMLKDHIHFSHVYGCQLVECKNCGTLCRNPRFSAEETYNEYSDDFYHPEWLNETYNSYCQSFMQEMPALVTRFGRDIRALEIGSQMGGFLYSATKYGWDIKGVDVGKTMSEYSRSKGFDVFTGALVNARFPDSCFDAVFVWNCFEMLPDPWSELREIRRIIKKNGKLFISVPNGEFIKMLKPFSDYQGFRPFRDFIWKTLAYGILLGFSFQLGYSKKSILRLLSQSGFQQISIKNQYYVPITSPKYMPQKFIAQKAFYLKVFHMISQLIYYASFGNLVKGPWLLIECEAAK